MPTKLYPFTLEVLNPPGWFLSLSQTALAVAKGDMAVLTVTAAPEYGFASTIGLYVIGLPKGTAVIINPSNMSAPGTALVEISTYILPIGPALALKLLGVSDGPQGVTENVYIVGDTPSEIAALLDIVAPGAEVYMLGDPERQGWRLTWGPLAALPMPTTPYVCYYATDTAAIYYAGATGAWEAYVG